MEAKVELISFFGHKDSVLDLATCCTRQLIATTSDDLTIRLWDLKISHNAIKCFRGYGDSVNSILFHPILDHLLIGSTDTTIIQFDTTLSGIIIQEYLPLYQTTSSEIISFAINPKDSNCIAIGDEEGIVSLYNLETKTIFKRLSRIHSNLLGQIDFNPINPTYLISGGFDSILCIWDTRRGRPSNIINFNDINQLNESNLQIANPPFVHALLHILNGRIIVCALGDGHIALYKSSDGSLSQVSNMIEAHRGMVTNLAQLGPSNHESFLTAGADGVIKIWDVQTSRIDDSQIVVPEGTEKRKKLKNSKTSKIKEWYEVHERRAIVHPFKINSISSINLGDNGIVVLVTDVTADWCLYKLS